MFLMLLVLLGVACVVATLSMARCQKRSVIASGTLLVTGTGDVVLDEDLSKFRKRLLKHPQRHIFVQFDDSDPGPAPCTSGPPDSVTWSLLFEHSHDELSHCKNCLKLKLSWTVASSRTISWRVLGNSPC